MKAEQATYALLAAAGGVAALVATRIYPGRLPQTHTLPALVYRMVGVPRELTHSGADAAVEARVQITAHATTYAGAKALQNAVRVAANGYSGSPGSVHVDRINVDDGPDLYDPDTETEQAISDLLISYQE